MAQPQVKESVTKINRHGEQSLLAEDLSYGDALGMVWRLRAFTNTLVRIGFITDAGRSYYRLGRPH